MIRRIKTLINQNKILLENFSFLSVLQISNLLIFLLTIPYLFRTLGKDNYGLVVYAQTIAYYFSMVVNFGFNVTATRDISVSGNNIKKISNTISSVLTLKSFFFLMSLLILSSLILFIPLFRQHPKVFYFSMLFCLSETFFPIWYFQGIEKMKYITFINISTRVVSASGIFLFVKNPDDYFLVPVLLGVGTNAGALIGLVIVFKSHHHRFRLPSFLTLKSYVKENVPLFISNVSSQIYVNANKLIVGSFLGMADVAIYDIADKIVNILKIPVSMAGQTLFPMVSRTRDVGFVKKAMIMVFVFFTIVYTAIYFFSNLMVQLFTGTVNPEAAALLRLLAASILPVCIGLFYAELLLIPFGKLKDYSRMRMFSLFIYLISIGVLYSFKQITLTNLAIAVIVVETFVLIYSYYLCKKNKII
jgi:PST family polysaccharide transporter